MESEAKDEDSEQPDDLVGAIAATDLDSNHFYDALLFFPLIGVAHHQRGNNFLA